MLWTSLSTYAMVKSFLRIFFLKKESMYLSMYDLSSLNDSFLLKMNLEFFTKLTLSSSKLKLPKLRSSLTFTISLASGAILLSFSSSVSRSGFSHSWIDS